MVQDRQKLYQRTGLNRNTNLCFEPHNGIQRSKSWQRNDDDNDDDDDEDKGGDDDDDLTIPKRKLLPK
jgi:hypothetical protein